MDTFKIVNFKMVNTDESFNKIHRLGISSDKVRPYDASEPFLFINDGTYHTGSKMSTFMESDFVEITQKDFLAFPEPIIVGDLCILGDGRKTYVVIRVKSIDGHMVNNEPDVDDNDSYFDLSDLKKLSPEQVEVLESWI